ncbi:DUF6639 family protein [Oricola indica]|uniref:DUF6639 family protein n=1 Tax=Oricola indica TaxID=2872591 RepID=UPI003CCBE6F2
MFAALLTTNSNFALADGNTDPHSCSNVQNNVEVWSNDAHEIAVSCEGVETAISFLQQCGVDYDGSLAIHFERDMRDECGVDTYGIYEISEKVIRINSYPTCRSVFTKSKLTGRIPFDEFFESIVVHEVTHAVVDAIGAESAKKPLTQEYIAYAVQYSMFEPADVSALTDDLLIKDHVALSDFSMSIYALSAEKFAAMVSSHFNGPDGGCKTIRDLVSGDRQMRESVHQE